MSNRPPSTGEREILQMVVLGDALVGKTALLRRLKGLPFEFTYRMTIGADFVIKRIEFNGIDVTLQIYDVGGQPDFSHLRSRYYSNTGAAIIVFDLMRRETYESIPNWLDEIFEKNNYRFVPILLIGNKEDLLSDQPSEVNQEEIDEYIEILENWGKKHNPNFEIIYRETSAKTGLNVEDAFLSLVEIVLRENI